jgi:hypothetical protein
MAVQVIASSYTDGPTLTGAATASAIPTYVPTSIPAGYWQIGRIWRVTATGRISNVVTTPGTARYDIRLGAVTVFDTLAMPLNIVVRNNVSWTLQVMLTCRSVGTGTSATLFGQGFWLSDAAINTAVAATGPGPGGHHVPYNTAPVVGTGFDSTIANAFDFRFTQTVATGSMTVHQFMIEQMTP